VNLECCRDARVSQLQLSFLVNVFIDLFSSKLGQKRNGCHIGSYFVGAILYADDLILLNASVSGLQLCLNTVFTARCTLVQSAVLRSHRLSV